MNDTTEQPTPSPEGNEEPKPTNETTPGSADTPPEPANPTPASNEPTTINTSRLELGKLSAAVESARKEIAQFLVGQEHMVDLIFAGILSNGHILLEGVPGIAKTLSAKLVAKTIKAGFSRVQFTPDLMPSDVTGTSVYNATKADFDFKKGPVFSNIILIDEINRAPAKTQAALFEVMEERQLTYDGTTYPMEFPFLVIATQNPVEQEGTYRLPEAQLDRFLFKIVLNYPSKQEESMILKMYRNQIGGSDLSVIKPIMDPKELQHFQGLVEQVVIEDNLIEYIASITEMTRNHGKLYLGASPRASLAMLRSSKAVAAMKGRDFVIPDDIQYVAPHVLNHRVIMTPDAELEGISSLDVVKEILEKIEVPR